MSHFEKLFEKHFMYWPTEKVCYVSVLMESYCAEKYDDCCSSILSKKHQKPSSVYKR